MSDEDMVGVRELRQNLSKYLRRVVRGETLRVTDRGHPVAVLAPLPDEASAVDRLVSEGRLSRARLDLASIGPPSPAQVDLPISAALEQQRGED